MVGEIGAPVGKSDVLKARTPAAFETEAVQVGGKATIFKYTTIQEQWKQNFEALRRGTGVSLKFAGGTCKNHNFKVY